ncbi:hypothetical protein ZWY2020_000432 [Hordeum vulgare]|nr:hypothetical protein ZWY2020_000432 [Hordeum vulgare]
MDEAPTTSYIAPRMPTPSQAAKTKCGVQHQEFQHPRHHEQPRLFFHEGYDVGTPSSSDLARAISSCEEDTDDNIEDALEEIALNHFLGQTKSSTSSSEDCK